MNKKELEIKTRLEKLKPLITPEGVLDIKFKIREFGDDRFHCDINFLVPDDSKHLNINSNLNQRVEWSKDICNQAWLYLNVRLIPSSTSITSNSHYERQRLLDEGQIKSRQTEALEKIQKMLL